MEKVLYAVDELTGLIGAVVIMRPSKSVQDLELKSVKKKYKSKGFAAGCSREVIERGADMLGWSLDELIERTIEALRTFSDWRKGIGVMENKSILIKDTTKEERIALIKQWIPDDDGLNDCDMDLWDIYDDYIKGVREVAEINAAMSGTFMTEEDLNRR